MRWGHPGDFGRVTKCEGFDKAALSGDADV